MTPANELTYAQAVSELESILRAIQADNCDIDKLSQLTSRATVLLKACRNKLTTTEQELSQILATLEGE